MSVSSWSHGFRLMCHLTFSSVICSACLSYWTGLQNRVLPLALCLAGLGHFGWNMSGGIFPEIKGPFSLVPWETIRTLGHDSGTLSTRFMFDLKREEFEARQMWIWIPALLGCDWPLSLNLLYYTRQGVGNNIWFSSLTHTSVIELEWGTVEIYTVVEQTE